MTPLDAAASLAVGAVPAMAKTTITKEVVRHGVEETFRAGVREVSHLGCVSVPVTDVTQNVLLQAGKSGFKEVTGDAVKRSAGNIVMGEGSKIVVHDGATFAKKKGAQLTAGQGAKIVTEGTGAIAVKSASTEAAKSTSKQAVKQAAVTGAVVEGALCVGFMCKDAYELSQGSISGATFAKRQARNVTSSGSSVGFAVLGQAVIPIPVVGAAVGGVVGSFLGKSLGSLFGWYDEDD